jgi:hypothetical protein
MDSVFIVWHVHRIVDDQEDEKLLGVYRTEQDATAAIARAREKPGFRDCPDGFAIDAYELNKDHWAEGFVTLP